MVQRTKLNTDIDGIINGATEDESFSSDDKNWARCDHDELDNSVGTEFREWTPPDISEFLTLPTYPEGVPPSNYQELVDTIEHTVQAASRLKEQNAVLSRKYEEVKAAKDRTQHRYGETRGALATLLEAKSENETNLENTVAQLRKQLEDRELEINQLKNAHSNAHSSAESIRLHAKNEVESEYATKIQKLNDQVRNENAVKFRKV